MLRGLTRKLTKHFEFKHIAKLVTIGKNSAGSGSAFLDWRLLQYAYVAGVRLNAHLERPRIYVYFDSGGKDLVENTCELKDVWYSGLWKTEMQIIQKHNPETESRNIIQEHTQETYSRNIIQKHIPGT